MLHSPDAIYEGLTMHRLARRRGHSCMEDSEEEMTMHRGEVSSEEEGEKDRMEEEGRGERRRKRGREKKKKK